MLIAPLLAVVTAFHLVQRCEATDQIRILLSNGTGILAIDDIVDLVTTSDYHLDLLEPEKASDLKVSMIDMFNEYSSITYPNETFVDSLSFRMGDVAQRSYQLVISLDNMYLYQLVSSGGSLKMVEQKRWSVNATVNKAKSKFFRANSTTTAIRRSSESIHFVLLTYQNGTVNEQLNILKVNCSSQILRIYNCDLSLVSQEPVTPMYFLNLTNSSDGIKCESTLRALSGDFSSGTNSSSTTDFEYYFARYCQLSQIDFSLQKFYRNQIQILGKDSNGQIDLIGILEDIDYLGNTLPLQMVEMVEFKSSLIYFDLERTYVVSIGNMSKIRKANQWFDNNYNLQTGYVTCQQNSYAVLSCYLEVYVKPMACPQVSSKRRLLEDCSPDSLEVYSTSSFTEFISLQSRIFRVPPFNLPMILAGDWISAINLNFIVFREHQETEGEVSSTKIKILQRGTSNDLGEYTLDGHVVGMKSLGDNIMMYRETDIGLTIRDLPSGGGFSLSLYTIQLPVFKIETKFANSSFLCYQYIKDCQPLLFNFSFTANVQQNDDRNEWFVMPFYLINGNFSGVLPKTSETILELPIQRDKLTFNLTDLFYGMPQSYHANSMEYQPGTQIGKVNLTLSGEAFNDLNINVTGGNFSDYCDPNLINIAPYIQRNELGDLFVSMRMACNDDQPAGKVFVFEMTDYLDLQQDSDISITYSNFQIYDFYTNADNSWLIVNDDIQYGQFYMFYSSVKVNGSISMMQFQVIDGSLQPQFFRLDPTLFPSLYGMRGRVIRSKGLTADNCIIAFNQSEARIYELVYPSINPQDRRVDFITQLTISIYDNSFDWPIGVPTKILDIYMADFNSLYVHVVVRLDNGTLTDIMQVHQCDFGDEPSCFFYTYVELNNQLVLIDDVSFNFLLIDKTNMTIDFYQLLDFKIDFMHLVMGKLSSSRTACLRGIMADDGISLVLNHLSRSLNAANNQIFSLGIYSELNPANNGFLVFNFDVQCMIPVRFVPFPDVKLMLIGAERNPWPYKYPTAYRFNPSTSNLEMFLINPSNGLSLRTPSYLISETIGETFQTEMFQAVLTSIGSPDFLQIFKGVTKLNFNLNTESTTVSEVDVVNLNGIVKGFIQNSTIYCIEDDDSEYLTTRNYSIDLQCASHSGKANFTLTPYIGKDFDFFWSSEARLDNLVPDNNILANITSFVRLNNGNEFLFLFHNNITVVRAKNTSKIILFVDLYDDEDEATIIDYDTCISLVENTLITESAELELLCIEMGNYYIFNFTLNMTQLRNTSMPSPQRILLPATRWKVINVLMEQFFSKSLKTFYMGKLLYVLDSIVLENYNNKPFLNIYQVVRVPNSNPKQADLSMVWSSLSMDTFSSFDIREFAVTRKQLDSTSLRDYLLHILLIRNNAPVTAYMTNEISVFVDGNIERTRFSLSNLTYFGDQYVEKLEIFSFKTDVYIYGFSKDSFVEWKALPTGEIDQLNTYKHLMICDGSSRKDLFRLNAFLFLYCYNSTSDGSLGDSVILYSTNLNSKDQVIYPVEQLNLPDVDFPSNKFLMAFQENDVGKFIISNSRTFMTQYKAFSNSSLIWKHSKLKGSVNFKVGFTSLNVLTTASAEIEFKIGLFDIVNEYFQEVQNSGDLLVVAIMYLLLLSGLLSIKYLRERAMISKNSKDKAFLKNYKEIMHNEQTKQNLLIMRDPKLMEEIKKNPF